MLTANNWAAPSPIEDEAFLLFLADTIEEDNGLVDPLSMTDKDKALTVKVETLTTQIKPLHIEQEDKNVK